MIYSITLNNKEPLGWALTPLKAPINDKVEFSPAIAIYEGENEYFSIGFSYGFTIKGLLIISFSYPPNAKQGDIGKYKAAIIGYLLKLSSVNQYRNTTPHITTVEMDNAIFIPLKTLQNGKFYFGLMRVDKNGLILLYNFASKQFQQLEEPIGYLQNPIVTPEHYPNEVDFYQRELLGPNLGIELYFYETVTILTEQVTFEDCCKTIEKRNAQSLKNVPFVHNYENQHLFKTNDNRYLYWLSIS